MEIKRAIHWHEQPDSGSSCQCACPRKKLLEIPKCGAFFRLPVLAWQMGWSIWLCPECCGVEKRHFLEVLGVAA